MSGGGFYDGNLDSQIDIYRDAKDGPCEICMAQEEGWKDRVIDKTVICSGKFEVNLI